MVYIATKITTPWDKWAKAKQLTREQYGWEFGRNEYRILSVLMQDLIVQRTTQYHLDAYGYTFAEYSWRTAAKKNPVEIGAPWVKTREVIAQLSRRLGKVSGDKEAERAIRAGIGHLWKVFDEQRREFYDKDKALKSSVDLVSDQHDNHMMDNIRHDGNAKSARVNADTYYAKWIQKGVNHDRKTKDGRPSGKLPARPFIGLTDAELRFLREQFLDPFFEWYLEAMTAVLLGQAPPRRPNPARIGQQALTRKPSKTKEEMSASR